MTSTAIPTTTTLRTEESNALADAPTQRRTFTVTGWVITGLVSAFMAFDVVVHLIQPAALVTPENSMGITSNALAVTGVLAVAIVALYLGIAAWAGTWLRIPAARSLMPFSRRSA